MTTTELKLDQIRLDGDTQSRVAINQEVVAEYADAMTEGEALPPVTVYFDGTDHWLADGFHRVLASRRIGALSIQASVLTGTAREAQIYAYSANRSHGLRRTNEDKRKAVQGMLALKPDWSDRAIGRHVGVTHTMVAEMRNPQAQERRQAARTKAAEVVPGTSPDATNSAQVVPGTTLPAAEPPAKKAARELGPVTSRTEAPAPDDSRMSYDEAIAEVERTEKEAAGLRADLAALAADDLKAEVLKWKRAYDHAQRTADEKMANAARLERELQQSHNRMLRIGKLFGERDAMKIPALVEAFYRQHAKVAA